MPDTTTKKHDWGMFAFGIMLVICAFILMAWPGLTLVSLAMMAGFMLLFSGGADLSAFIAAKGASGRGWILVSAILDIVLGAMFLIHPLISAQVLPWLAGAFIAGYGIVMVVTSFGLRKLGPTWIVLLLSGIVSVVLGFLIAMNPMYFVLFVGIYLAMRGVMMAVYGIVSPRALAY